MTTIGNLVVKLTGDTAGWKRSADETLTTAGKLKKGLVGTFEQVTGSSLTAAGVVTTVGMALKYSIKQALEAERVTAATEATIRATGGAAGFTAEEIGNLALAESRLTSIDDEVVQSGMNMLLTFRNIGNETFPRAARAAEDMAVAMANGDTSALDLKGTAIQLGKALQDPIAGVTALQKVGVTLSDQQKQQIVDFMAINDIASAQGVILAELEGEFGGMAEAMGGTDAGKILKAKNEIDNLAASIGGYLLPVVGNAAESFNVLLSFQDGLDTAFNNQKVAVLEATDNYDGYSQSIIYAALKSKQFSSITEMELAESILDGTIAVEDRERVLGELISTVGGSTAAEWAADRATQAWNISMGGSSAGLHLTAEQAAQFSTVLNTELLPPIDVAKASMQDLTAQLLYNQAAAGLDAAASLELARGLGLVDEGTYAALSQTQSLRDQLDAGTISADGYRDAVIDIAEAYLLIPQRIDTTWTISVGVTGDPLPEWGDAGLGDGPVIVTPDTGAVTGGGVVPAFANGADFVATNPMLIMVGEGSSNEHVQVTPLNGRTVDDGGKAVTYNVYIQGGDEVSVMRGLQEFQVHYG